MRPDSRSSLGSALHQGLRAAVLLAGCLQMTARAAPESISVVALSTRAGVSRLLRVSSQGACEVIEWEDQRLLARYWKARPEGRAVIAHKELFDSLATLAKQGWRPGKPGLARASTPPDGPGWLVYAVTASQRGLDLHNLAGQPRLSGLADFLMANTAKDPARQPGSPLRLLVWDGGKAGHATIRTNSLAGSLSQLLAAHGLPTEHPEKTVVVAAQSGFVTISGQPFQVIELKP